MIVFDDENTGEDTIGWAVDDSGRVTRIETGDVEKSDEAAIIGIVNRDGGFLPWTAPDTIPAICRIFWSSTRFNGPQRSCYLDGKTVRV